MVTLPSIVLSLDPGDWHAVLNLKDTYFLAVHQSHRRFLSFVMVNVHYQFRVLPFGLSSAPQVFTKCM